MSKIPQNTFSGADVCALEAHVVVDLLRRGEVSSAELLAASFARIAAVEPLVNALPTLCRARAEAAVGALDDSAKDHPGWLGGLPIGIKDLTPVEGVRTTHGTKALADHVPEVSDPLVLRLEERGGLVVGKTNTPEFGAGGNTFNEVFGKTRNPYDTTLNAAGSSGGAAVSVATGEVWLSHGSDHGGSLRTPAAYNGIVGLRPSPGMCASGSELGFVIEGQQGPMARSVRDCALFLDAMAGFQPSIPTSFPPVCEGSFQQAVVEAGSKVRIGFAPDLNGFSPVEPVIDAKIRWALGEVEKNGGLVEETCPDLPELERTYHTLRGILWASAFKRAPESLTKHFKKTLRDNTEFGRNLTIDDVTDAQLDRTTIFKNMTAFHRNFDVLACPVVGNMPHPVDTEWVDEVNGVKFDGYMDWLRFAFLATTAGLPAISVPVGFSDAGMPIAIQLIGPHRGEAKLLAVARAVEMAVGGPLGPIDPNVTHL